MLELVISACLLDDQSLCKEVSLTHMGESVTPMMCLMMSPAEIAKWNERNPYWFAKKWSCRPAGRFA